jgi:hypothetical protein
MRQFDMASADFVSTLSKRQKQSLNKENFDKLLHIFSRASTLCLAWPPMALWNLKTSNCQWRKIS